MNESYFLTKQTANLMEDFDRELKAEPAFYLLYGEARVGKSRLLQELIKTRLGDKRVHGIELRSSDQDGKGGQDRSVEIENTFARAQPGDIIIADHFESALKKTRHQLFVSWSTDGVDKQLRMIVCSSLDGFNELRELALRYKVGARSFRLKPFSSEEIEAFYAFYLFQDQLVGKLIFPPWLRKQIQQSRGVVGDLIDIAKRDGDQIENVPLSEIEPAGQKRWVMSTVLVMILIASGLVWYLQTSPDSFDDFAEAPTQPDAENTIVLAETESEKLSQEELTFEPEADSIVNSTLDSTAQAEPELPPEETVAEADETSAVEEVENTIEPATDEEISSLAAAEEAAPLEEELVANEAPVTEVAALDSNSAANGTASQNSIEDSVQAQEANVPDSNNISETLSVDTELASVEIEPQPVKATNTLATAEDLSDEARFERDLQASLDWLDNRPNETGIVQIMLLQESSFEVKKYYGFLDRLERKNVDLSQIRVYHTMTANRQTYSVFYDEFPTRRDAMRALDYLPEAIRDTSPIPRSVGGLWEEIRRLEANN